MSKGMEGQDGGRIYVRRSNTKDLDFIPLAYKNFVETLVSFFFLYFTEESSEQLRTTHWWFQPTQWPVMRELPASPQSLVGYSSVP